METKVEPLTLFIHLEKAIRHAENVTALGFILANDTKKLLNFHQAFFWLQGEFNQPVIKTVSGSVTLNNDAPLIVWLKQLIRYQLKQNQPPQLAVVTASSVSEAIAIQWSEWLPPYVLFLPINNFQGERLGGLILTRTAEWQTADKSIAALLADVSAHALQSLQHQRTLTWRQRFAKKKTKLALIAAVIIIVIFCLPVRLTALAPAEVMARDPEVVAAPLNGVISHINVEPNQTVVKGQKLYQLDATELSYEFQLAQKNLALAIEKYRKAYQSSFNDKRSKVQLAVLKIDIDKAKTQLKFTQQLLARATVYSPDNGIIIFTNKGDWIGKPVKIGEKVMVLADGKQKELDMFLSSHDIIPLRKNSLIKLYLNVDPLKVITARLRYVSYEASEQADGQLAYLVKADFTNPKRIPKIGLRGTAKIYGQRVVLIYYLLRRPLTALRHFFGV